MKGQICIATLMVMFAISAVADHHGPLIEEALSAAPPAITAGAEVKDGEGNVLKAGTNGWTCYPGSAAIGPMCNEPKWDELLSAMGSKQPFVADEFSISYMLAGEGEALGVSNSDPYATDPHAHGDFVKEGPHLMIIMPNKDVLNSLSTNPEDPVYVMWKDTPYAHIMVKIAPDSE